LGEGTPFSPADFSLKSENEDVNGNKDDISTMTITLTSDVPIYGLKIYSSGLDPYCIAAITAE